VTVFKAKFRRESQSKIDHRLLLPQASASTFIFELPPYPTDNTVPVYHVVAPCTGSCLEDWMGLDIAVCAVGKVRSPAIFAYRLLHTVSISRCIELNVGQFSNDTWSCTGSSARKATVSMSQCFLDYKTQLPHYYHLTTITTVSHLWKMQKMCLTFCLLLRYSTIY